MYRSFVKCDDPMGVVDCNTIRKPKSDSEKMEKNIEKRRPKRHSNGSSEAEKEEIDEFSPTSFQIMEVSRGAQNLNQMIDKWSQRVIYDGQSREIAKDLLEGALDLQQSLIMLGKLQEASQYMVHLKKKEKSEKEKISEDEYEKICLYHIDYGNNPENFQKPRISADGSFRNSTEELKKVIKDSFFRQNLLPSGKGYFCPRNMDSASEIASSSSSQSSMVHETPQKKVKGTNLIAKLMGLEQIPSKQQEVTLRKKILGENILNQKGSVSDIEMPKTRESQLVIKVVDPEKRTVKEILETVHFNRLLKNDSLKKVKLHCYHYGQRVIDKYPPIVLIKPLHVPHIASVNNQAPTFWEQEAFDMKKALGKMKTKEESPKETIDCKVRALSSKKMHRKMDSEEVPPKRIMQKGAARDRKEETQKPEQGIVNTKETGTTKLKSSSLLNQNTRKKDAKDKKAPKLKKMNVGNNYPLEKEIEKDKIVSRSQDQVKTIPNRPRKPVTESGIIKNQIPQKPSSTSNAVSKSATQTMKINQKKEQVIKEPIEVRLATDNVDGIGDDKTNDLTNESASPLTNTNGTQADLLPMEEETNGCESAQIDSCSESQNSLCEDAQSTHKYETDANSAREDNLKALLLSTPSFIRHAEELFDVNTNGTTILQASCNNDTEMPFKKLSFECAIELIERKSLQDSRLSQPLLPLSVCNSRIWISLEKLVEDVCDAIEILRSYWELDTDPNVPVDVLYSILDKDIKSKGMINGIWDSGWRNGFSTDEAEEVVNAVEKLILSGLIDEVFV